MSSATRVEHRVGQVDQIALGHGQTFQVAGHEIAVFRLRGGGVAATESQCPHRGGPLADGIVGLDSVVCPLHAWRFSLATGATDNGDCPVAIYPCRLDEAGEILVALPVSDLVRSDA